MIYWVKAGAGEGDDLVPCIEEFGYDGGSDVCPVAPVTNTRMGNPL